MSSISTAYMVASAQKANRASTQSSPRTSGESASATQVVSEQKTSSSFFKRTAEKVKKAAREHHNGVNAAYQTYYGMGQRVIPERV